MMTMVYPPAIGVGAPGAPDAASERLRAAAGDEALAVSELRAAGGNIGAIAGGRADMVLRNVMARRRLDAARTEVESRAAGYRVAQEWPAVAPDLTDPQQAEAAMRSLLSRGKDRPTGTGFVPVAALPPAVAGHPDVVNSGVVGFDPVDLPPVERDLLGQLVRARQIELQSNRQGG